MPTVYILEYASGLKEELFASGGTFYVINENTFLDCEDTFAWCFSCNALVSIEDVPTIEQLEDNLRAINVPGSAAYLKIFRRVRSPQIDQWWKYKVERRLAWRRLRSSPALCQQCRRQELFEFPFNKWVPHPGTSELCRFYSGGLSCVGYKRYTYLDIEGSPLNLSDEDYAAIQIRRKAWEAREKENNPFPSEKR